MSDLHYRISRARWLRILCKKLCIACGFFPVPERFRDFSAGGSQAR
jgi:hypothetical protein